MNKRVLLCLALCCLGTSGCKTPTEVTIELVSELGHRPDMKVMVQLDRPDRVEAAPPRVVTTAPWSSEGTIGTVVAVASDDAEDTTVRVVLATGRDPAGCTANDATGCVVVRRRVRFVKGESSRTRVVLRRVCVGVYCDSGSSCAVDGSCGSLDDDGAVGGDASAPAPLADAGDPYANAVLDDRPRHYYRFDEPEGASVAKDATGRADGTYEAVRLGVTGALESSANPGAFFDGRGRVTVPKAEDFPGAMSVEVWARADTLEGARPTIVERVDAVGGSLFGYRVSKPPGSEVAFELFRGNATFTALAPAVRFADYTHFVAIVKAGELQLWRNGIRLRSEALTGSLPSSVLGPLVIGGSAVGESPFKGAIDELALYDYPLDADQMKRHLDAAKASR